MKQTNKQQKTRAPITAYAGYLFQTFLKRPFGYIIAVLYIVYLAVILVIVPKALHFEPLFIWNVGGFNMPIYNLFFIAASAASIAVAVFRTGRDDGTDLTLSAKPITKGAAVGIKTVVYLIIMAIICGLTVAIVALVLPIFGEYNSTTNITGITTQKYVGLVLSVLIGNIVNMLFFGGIAVFISMIGGQVITIIGNVAIVFVMCILNFLFPQVIKSQTDVLSDKYDTEILSYSCNTLHQYNDKDDEGTPLNFATIQCITDDSGEEEYHYDTKEYWDIASRESGSQYINYIDIGKQLSGLYSAFGLDESKLIEASKLVIGTNNSYNYEIKQETHVSDKNNLDAQNYPISFYGMKTSQGKSYPQVNIVGASMTLDLSNWYLLSTLWQIEFNSISYVSSTAKSMSIPDGLRLIYVKPWYKMPELRINQEQADAAIQMYQHAKITYEETPEDPDFSIIAHTAISHDQSGAFFEPNTFDSLKDVEKLDIISKIHLYWAIEAQRSQNQSISDYCSAQGIQASFPYPSKVVKDWYNVIDKTTTGEYNKKTQEFNDSIYSSGIAVDGNGTEDVEPSAYSRLVTSKMSYAETFSNLYQYNVTNFYNVNLIITIWTVISGALFAGSIIVYKKTDFK